MAGAGIRSFDKFRGQMPRIVTTGITSLQTALKWTADCKVPRSGCRGQVKPVAICSQIHTSICGNPRDGYSILGNPRSKRAQVAAVKSSLWQSTLKFILLSVAIRATVILFLAIRVLNAANCGNPQHTFERGT
jgi:hypothetical protein